MSLLHYQSKRDENLLNRGRCASRGPRASKVTKAGPVYTRQPKGQGLLLSEDSVELIVTLQGIKKWVFGGGPGQS